MPTFIIYTLLLFSILACQDSTKGKEEPDNKNFDISDTVKRSKEHTAKEKRLLDTLLKRTEAYQDIDIYSQNRAKVRLGNLYGYIDRDSFEIIKPQYTSATRFEDSVARVGKAGKYGLIDLVGKEVIPFVYEELGQVKDSMLSMKKGNLYGFLHTKRKKQEIVPPRYEWAGNFIEKRAKVMLKGKWTFIDSKGKEITPLQYDAVRDFREGLAAVWQNYQWGYINPQGKIILKPQYDQALDFTKGKAQVTQQGRTFYINAQGREVGK